MRVGGGHAVWTRWSMHAGPLTWANPTRQTVANKMLLRPASDHFHPVDWPSVRFRGLRAETACPLRKGFSDTSTPYQNHDLRVLR